MSDQINETTATPVDDDEAKVLGMSDAEVMNMTEPAPALSGSKPEAEVESKAETAPTTPVVEEKPVEEQKAETPADEAVLNAKDEEVDKKTEKKGEEKPADAAAETKPEDDKKEPETQEAPDYKGFYDKIMAPIKASNRTLQVKSVDEAVKLMQFGADYTRRMQQLRPNLKLMKMLQNNDLLSEEKLTFLIDLDKNNPDAVNKFLKDRNIDPLDLDPQSEKEYKPGNHSVSDAEMVFNQQLDELKSTQQGKETITHIERDWDQQSIEMLYKEPEIMKLIDEQRADGIASQITAELDRRKMLGQIPAHVPFLTAYQAIGAELHQAGKLLSYGKPTLQQPQQVPPGQPQQQAPQAPVQQRQVLESRPANQKPVVRNNAAAKAAAPVRTTPGKPAPVDFNPLAMSDAEFEKHAGSFKI